MAERPQTFEVGHRSSACVLVIALGSSKLAGNHAPAMRFSLLPLLFGIALFAGCSSMNSVSMPSSVRERFTGPTYRTRVVETDQRKAYEAAKLALKEIDFRFVNGGAAQGKLRAISGVSSSSDLRGSRQMELDVKLAYAPGGTEVAVLFSEITEENSSSRSGMGTSAPLRDSALYEVYYRAIQKALAKL